MNLIIQPILNIKTAKDKRFCARDCRFQDGMDYCYLFGNLRKDTIFSSETFEQNYRNPRCKKFEI